MELPRSMTSHYHLFQVCLFLLVITACSSPDSAPIVDPPNLSSGMATLSWNASTGPDVAGYKIYQATASGAYVAPIATLTGNTTSYVISGLETNTTYFFVVTAYNSDGTESSFSNEVRRSIL